MGRRWCSDCQKRVPRVHEPFCEKCGIPTNSARLCDKCKSNPPAYQVMRSWAVFDSSVQNALHTLKHRRYMGIGDALAIQMADFVHELNWNIDILVPVPLGEKRLKERGYNQVGLVAHPLANEIGLLYSPQSLRKTRDTRSQVGLSVSRRRENAKGAYQAEPESVRRKSVLLTDDVSTTGSTMQSCAEALLAAGAREVHALTIARALSHHDLNRV